MHSPSVPSWILPLYPSGMVMAMYSKLKTLEPELPKDYDIQHTIDGNLCRCTGYMPLINAMGRYLLSPFGAQPCPRLSRTTTLSLGDSPLPRSSVPCAFSSSYLWHYRTPSRLSIPLSATRPSHASPLLLFCWYLPLPLLSTSSPQQVLNTCRSSSCALIDFYLSPCPISNLSFMIISAAISPS